MYLQQFQYEVTYIRGTDNVADVLSRLPVASAEEGDGKDTEEFAYSVASEAMPVALVPSEVEALSAKDATLELVRQAVISSDWSKLQGTTYKMVKDELWVVGQLVMRGGRIVMPENLWNRTVMLAHEGHQGVVRTKARLREKVWWPGMDKQVEAFVRCCYPCQLVGPRGKPEPLRPTELPEGPWQEIGIDLLEINSTSHLLVVVDYFSRWVEAIFLHKTDASHVIKSLESIFRTHGLPNIVRSDNAPPFSSREFKGFLEYLGIVHKKGVPYWPQSNGEVERCNETLLKIVRIAEVESRDWKKELSDFLFHYRVTPHTVTGLSPAELLMGRKLRDKLPKLQISGEQATEADWQKLMKEREYRAKMKQKTYADKKRGARPSDIAVGDRVLLKQSRENKLSTNFERHPYKVVRRDGNAVVIEDVEGNSRMRGIAHIKKYIEREENQQNPNLVESAVADAKVPIADTSSQDISPQSKVSESPVLEADVPIADVTISNNSSQPIVSGSRPVRNKRPPVWMKDYIRA